MDASNHTHDHPIHGADGIRALRQEVAKTSRCDFILYRIDMTKKLSIDQDLLYSLHPINIFSTPMMTCKTASQPATGLPHHVP